MTLFGSEVSLWILALVLGLVIFLYVFIRHRDGLYKPSPRWVHGFNEGLYDIDDTTVDWLPAADHKNHNWRNQLAPAIHRSQRSVNGPDNPGGGKQSSGHLRGHGSVEGRI